MVWFGLAIEAGREHSMKKDKTDARSVSNSKEWMSWHGHRCWSMQEGAGDKDGQITGKRRWQPGGGRLGEDGGVVPAVLRCCRCPTRSWPLPRRAGTIKQEGETGRKHPKELSAGIKEVAACPRPQPIWRSRLTGSRSSFLSNSGLLSVPWPFPVDRLSNSGLSSRDHLAL